MKIVEKKYRGSVICRVLGYPISYAIVKMLLEKRGMSFTDIVQTVKRSKSTVCGHLTKLRLAHVIRYEKNGRETMYWIKYPKYVQSIMDACESMVKRVSQRIDKDV